MQRAPIEFFRRLDESADPQAVMGQMPVVVEDETVARRSNPCDGASKLFRKPKIVGVEKCDGAVARGFDGQIEKRNLDSSAFSYPSKDQTLEEI